MYHASECSEDQALYWFLRHSELKCMIRDFGPPTLFLTFSCAEYESTDMATYLKRVNGIPEGRVYQV